MTLVNGASRTTTYGLSALLEVRRGEEWVLLYRLARSSAPPVEPRTVPADEELTFVHIGFTVAPGDAGPPLTHHIPALEPGSYRLVKADPRSGDDERPMEGASVSFLVGQP